MTEQAEDDVAFQELALGSAHSTFLDGHGEPPQPQLKRYLCYFLHRYLEFRIPEVESLAELALGSHYSGRGEGPPGVLWEMPVDGLASPFWWAHLPSDADVAKAAKSCLLAKVFLEVWGEGANWDELFESIRAYPQHLKAPYEAADQSFRFVVDCYGAKLTMEQQVAVVESFHWMQFKGPIDLKNPQHKFWVVIANDTAGPSSNMPVVQARIFFGREVAVGDRSVIPRYELRNRRYLGPTSMDTEMAFLMCNMGKVRPGNLVFDPFVGTGSILVAAAARGAMTLGSDIDMRIIKLGKKDKAGNPVNNWTNFSDYGLPPPLGLLRADLHRPPFRDRLEEVIDAIVCDPPYGVRAGGRKSVPKDFVIEDRLNHIASLEDYSLGECLRDLLDLAARLLTVGGRLVYFLPAVPGREEELPSHPALTLIANSEQILSRKYSRRLVTMEKARRYDAAAVAAHHEALGPPRMAIDELREHVYSSSRPNSAAGSDAEAGSSCNGEAGGGSSKLRVPRHRGKTV